MARIILKVGLCSLIILTTFNSAASAHDLPISIADALMIPESELDQSTELQKEHWTNFGTPDCRILDRILITSQPVTIENIVATCPTEANSASATLPVRHSKDESISLNPFWADVQTHLSSTKRGMIEFIRSSEQTLGAWSHQACKQTVDSIGITWRNVNETTDYPTKSRVPAVLTSHSIPNDAFESNDITPEIESNEPTESLIELPEGTQNQDSYWQYYEDCDRWGVNFAGLLFEAQSHLANNADQVNLVQKQPKTRVRPHFSIARIVAAQNISTWLYDSPQMQNRVSDFVFRWLQLVEFNAIEVIETEFVLVDDCHSTTPHEPTKPCSLVTNSKIATQSNCVSDLILEWAAAVQVAGEDLMARTSMTRMAKQR